MSTYPPIMLVEDNPLDVDLTLRAFQRRKLANPVVVARDGEEALAWVARWEAGEMKPAVILLDLNIPRIDGLAVLRTMKAHQTLRRIPIVVLPLPARIGTCMPPTILGSIRISSNPSILIISWMWHSKSRCTGAL